MGRTTSSRLTSADGFTDFVRGSMAPQKIWNVETLLPCNFETAANSIDEILLDIKKNAFHMEFEEMIGSSVQKGLCNQVKAETHNHREVTSEFLNLHSVVDNDTKKREVGERQSLLLKDMLVGDYHNNTTLSDGKVTDSFFTKVIFLDHSYAHSLWKPHELWSDSRVHVKTEDASNQSAPCSNPKLGIEEQSLASCMEFSKNYMGFKPLSPASSTSSLAADLASSSSYSILSGDESDDMLMGTSSPVLPSSDLAFTNSPSTLSQKRKQFKAKILTPLERNKLQQCRFLNHKSSMGNKLPSKGLDFKTDSNPTNCSLNSDNVFPKVSSSSLDWDRYETESETLNGFSDNEVAMTTFSDDESSVTERLQSVFHDHDYCSKVRFDCGLRKLISLNVKDNIGMFKDVKRKYTKRNKINGFNEKILKAKYLKKELLKRDSSQKPVLNLKPKLTGPAVIKPDLKSVGRQRKKVFNKSTDEAIHPETEKKLKITGKFQDQYVYYLSKSSRTSSRGRQTASSSTSDKHLALVPKPGDIVIPHLTDADIEAVRLKGRTALKQPARPHSTSASSHPMPFQSVSSFSDNAVEHMYDVDSHIVSTILSMESDNVSYPTSQASDISTSTLNSTQPADISTSNKCPNQSAAIINTSSLNPKVSTSNFSPNQSADIINTSSLNPNQPALTESLRLMSGDPTITSEHVLNYLLSLMKDDEFPDSEYGSETVFFPPLSSDSINMADQAARTEEVFCGDNNIEIVSPGDEFLDMMNCVEITSSDEILHHGAHSYPDHCFHPSRGDCGSDATLLDDLSLMLESKEVLFPPGNLHRDCSNSVKKTFKPDSSEEIPQVTSSVDKLRSIEKTIDYLYRKDDVFDHTQVESSSVTTPVADDTPWIVTVTLYFNDVPAIMINNEPYIRLVDIYKQILPAKDTGILKKRCQLMNLPIRSCTEMQRYFLVQYGKACNSKSTIIVSKIHAADLIAYYTTPQSRAGRRSQDQKIQPDTSQIFHTSRNGKHKSKRSKKTSVPQSFSVSEDPGKPQCIQKDTFNVCETLSVPCGKQKKHKKANYLGLLNDHYNEKSSVSTATKALESVLKTTSSQTSTKHSIKMSRKFKHSMEDLSKSCFYIHQNGDSVEKKHNKKDSNNSKLEIKLPTKVFSETESRTNYLGMPQKNKHQSVKYEVKKPKKCKHKKRSLHHKKDLPSTSTSTDRSLRTLPVKHQSAFEDDIAPQLPPQLADLYIDLFVRPDSACVRCVTCTQFLSVPHFMNHHHVANDSELLATEAAQRILVPQNSTSMSKSEQRLWRKFQHLQKTVGSSGGVDDRKGSEYHAQNTLALPQPSSSSLLHTDQSLQFTSNKRKRKHLSRLSSTSCRTEDDGNSDDTLWLQQQFSPTPISTVSSNHKHPKEATSDLVPQNNTHKSKLLAESTDAKMFSLRSGRLSENNVPSARTSTRKRKSKQFFSIENY